MIASHPIRKNQKKHFLLQQKSPIYLMLSKCCHKRKSRIRRDYALWFLKEFTDLGGGGHSVQGNPHYGPQMQKERGLSSIAMLFFNFFHFFYIFTKVWENMSKGGTSKSQAPIQNMCILLNSIFHNKMAECQAQNIVRRILSQDFSQKRTTGSLDISTTVFKWTRMF